MVLEFLFLWCGKYIDCHELILIQPLVAIIPHEYSEDKLPHDCGGNLEAYDLLALPSTNVLKVHQCPRFLNEGKHMQSLHQFFRVLRRVQVHGPPISKLVQPFNSDLHGHSIMLINLRALMLHKSPHAKLIRRE